MLYLQETLSVPYKVQAQVAKWNEGRTEADGDPDEVVDVSIYFNEYGEVETDPERIEELEQLFREGLNGSLESGFEHHC